MKISHLVTLIITTLILITSCTNESFDNFENTDSEISQETLDKLGAMGFDTKAISIEKQKDRIFIDGDHFITNESLQKIDLSSKQTYSNIVFCNTISDVKVFNNVKNSTFRKGLSNAIRRWNNVSDALVNFVEINSVDQSRDAVVVNQANSSQPDKFASSELAAFGVPGRAIIVDLKARDSKINRGKALTEAQWTNIMTHHLGHLIGFAHTGSKDGIRIDATPANDKKSVMNANYRNYIKHNNFSMNDIKAIRKLYGTDKNNRGCE